MAGDDGKGGRECVAGVELKQFMQIHFTRTFIRRFVVLTCNGKRVVISS